MHSLPCSSPHTVAVRVAATCRYCLTCCCACWLVWLWWWWWLLLLVSDCLSLLSSVRAPCSAAVEVVFWWFINKVVRFWCGDSQHEHKAKASCHSDWPSQARQQQQQQQQQQGQQQQQQQLQQNLLASFVSDDERVSESFNVPLSSYRMTIASCLSHPSHWQRDILMAYNYNSLVTDIRGSTG